MNTDGKTRILFVEDEPIIRELLRVTVGGMEKEWDATFAASGEEAIAHMAQTPFDVVVSDMHMTGITGAELLNLTMQRYPATVRIILSAGAERELVLLCVGATHQFLKKPFYLPELQATLRRVGSLKERLRSPEVQRLVARSDHLPSIPSVYFRILDALTKPNCQVDQVSEIVASDPALTTKILQLVNSAFFGIAREISSAEEAVMILGVGTIRSLALTTQVFASSTANGKSGLEEIWNHSVRVANLARKIALLEGGGNELGEQTFTSGMLHDVGKLILADNLGVRYLEVLARTKAENRRLDDIEREEFQATHAEVGAFLLDLWGLPVPLVEAVALHHQPRAAPATAISALTIVHAADALEHQARAANKEGTPSLVDQGYLRQLGLQSRLEAWREVAARPA